MRRRRRASSPVIDIAPLIDVVFILLIFFMVSTTFTRESRLHITLPTADTEPGEMAPDSIEITIDQDGAYAINGVALINRQRDTLVRGLRELAAGNREVPVTISADARTAHQAVVTAMEAVGKAGFANLNITSQLPESGGN
ncbi:MAG TPA: biopolymer transporter ExbD [Porticoccaceae bacterium]|nr:biopolymer transporter ExbD [Porticoccaceae bacterium]